MTVRPMAWASYLPAAGRALPSAGGWPSCRMTE